MNAWAPGHRVLLVEDELLVAYLLQDMLADLGCGVVGPAVRVDEALGLIDAERIDAAVLDICLNGQLSYPVADALAARGIPFLFSTGYDPDRVREAYREAPILQKPFHCSDLGRVLTTLLPTKSVATRRVRLGRVSLSRTPGSGCSRASQSAP